jgi:hypothetical protein
MVMPAINLRNVELEVRADLRHAASLANTTLEAYCVSVLKAHLATLPNGTTAPLLPKGKDPADTPLAEFHRQRAKSNGKAKTAASHEPVAAGPLLTADQIAEFDVSRPAPMPAAMNTAAKPRMQDCEDCGFTFATLTQARLCPNCTESSKSQPSPKSPGAIGKKCPHGWMNWGICDVCNPK